MVFQSDLVLFQIYTGIRRLHAIIVRDSLHCSSPRGDFIEEIIDGEFQSVGLDGGVTGVVIAGLI